MFEKVFSAAVPFSSFINSPVFPDIYTKVEQMLMLKKKCSKRFSSNFSFSSLKTQSEVRPTSVCERLDVIRQVYVHTLCILHLLKDDPNKPH